MALLSTEDSNDSQKRMRAVLTIHPTLSYPFFSLIRPLFLRVLPKGGRICEGLLYREAVVIRGGGSAKRRGLVVLRTTYTIV